MKGAIGEFADHPAYLKLLSGSLSPLELRDFIRHLFVPHYQATHIIAFVYALLPGSASEMIKENLLEELGAKPGEEPHPQLLIELAKGTGLSDAEIQDLVTASEQEGRDFCAQQLPFPNLRDVGLVVLIEAAAFEHLLSQHAPLIGRALHQLYGLPEPALRWFTLHGELDVRHAEESLVVLEEYSRFHHIGERQVQTLVHAALSPNPFIKRYFPASLVDLPTGAAPAGAIKSITVYLLKIPFIEAFRHAQYDRTASDAIVVRVRDREGNAGYGEALPRSYVTGETTSGVVAYIRESAGWVFGLELNDPEVISQEVAAYGRSEVYGQADPEAGELSNAAFCALELAVLDLAHRRSGTSLAALIPPQRREIAYSGVVPATDPAAAAALARRFVDAGIRQIKLKVGIDDDVARLAAVRAAIGDDIGIRVDANGAWELDEAISALHALRPFGLESVEQPVSHAHPDHVARLRAVRERTGIPLIADESLNTLAEALRLSEARACDFFNVRISKNGGLLGALAVAKIGEQAGIKIGIGSQVGETAILTAAGRLLAAHFTDLSFAEGSFGTLLLSQDIADQEMRFGLGGLAPALSGSGLGIDVRQDSLERLAIDTIEIGRNG